MHSCAMGAQKALAVSKALYDVLDSSKDPAVSQVGKARQHKLSVKGMGRPALWRFRPGRHYKT